MTVYIYLDENHRTVCMCSYNPFVVYLGTAEDRTSMYFRATCPRTADPLKDFPELLL